MEILQGTYRTWRRGRAVSLPVLLFAVLTFSGCFYRQPVRHLASEVCLVTAHSSTRKDVLVYLGQPQVRRHAGQANEEWIYYEVHRSTLRKTPYIGEKLGNESYDVAVVRFDGDVVADLTYRLFTEDEFKKAGFAGTVRDEK